MVLTLLPVSALAVDRAASDGDALKKLFSDVKAGEASSGDVIVTLKKDYNLTDYSWTSLTVDGYHGAGIVTVEGNNHTITGLNAPLFAGGFAGRSGTVIKNLTLTGVKINDNTSDQGIGAFINNVDSMPKIELDNCHLTDSKITSTGGARVGGLIGWTSGYNKENDGPVDTYITVKNCSVENTEITAKGSVGGIIGHAGCNPATFHTFNSNAVINCTLNSTDNDGWRVGVVVGTANVGEISIANTTESNNILTQTGKTFPEGQSDLYGRFVPNTTGKLVIDGVPVFNSDITAAIGSTGYKTLADAVAAADNTTVTLLKDTTENVTIPAGRTIKLDLNGYTLSGGNVANKAALLNNGIVIIKDSSGNNTGKICREDNGASGYYVIDNQGTMTIESGSVYNKTGTMPNGSSLIRNAGLSTAATLTVTGGYLKQDGFIAVKNDDHGILNITGGTIETTGDTATTTASAVQNWSTANITGGTIKGTVWTGVWNNDFPDSVTTISGSEA